jgi:Scramblase
METLYNTHKLVIKQKSGTLCEAECRHPNEFEIFTDDGHITFHVIENSEYCGLTGRFCCQPNHTMQLEVLKAGIQKNEKVMMFDRPWKCGQVCSVADICRQEMNVYDVREGKDPTQIGFIKQPMFGGCFSPALEIMDRDETTPVACVKAKAVWCIGGLCCDRGFHITDASGMEIGKISRGPDADTVVLECDKDLSVKKKASILAALLLLDYMFDDSEGWARLECCNISFKFCDLYCFGCVCPCALGCCDCFLG